MRMVFQAMRDNKLYLKRSKCIFGEASVSYLGHIISHQGVAMDLAKIEAVQAWPRPTSVRTLKGFLDLTGYYRKFIKNYGAITRPLTQLLKEAFVWSPEADHAFENLQHAWMKGLVLQLQDFNDASSSIATHRAPDSAQCFIKRAGRSRSSAASSHHITPTGVVRKRAHRLGQDSAPLAAIFVVTTVFCSH